MKLNRQKKELLAALASALVAAVLAFLSVNYLSFLNSLENKASDIRTAALQKPMPQDKNIVVVAINEETITQFQYRSPVDREFLANLLMNLDKKGAKVIGLDILIDQATEEKKDQLLKQTFTELKTPLVVSYANTPNIVNEDQLDYLNRFLPEQNRGVANLAVDPFDGAVRWIYPGESDAKEPKGFARKLAQTLGLQTDNRLVEIAWRARPDQETPPFAIYPANSVAVLPAEWFKDKVVLIGAVLSITDRHQTPFAVVNQGGEDGMMSGVMIHAHSLSQLIDGRPEPEFSPLWSKVIILLAALLGVLICIFKKGILFNVMVGIVVVVAWWLGVMLGHGYGLPLIPLVAPTLSLALSIWMMDMLIGRAERKQRQFVQGAFSRYVSPAVVGQLVDNPEALSISGVKREATFIFTDIAGFTTLSEKLTSEKLSEVLNEYLDGACQIIHRYEGTVDKFIGDAIMCIFNAPLEQEDHALRAVKCALELDEYAEAFRKRQNAVEIPIGVTRIGVHTGMATVGNFGSASRMDFTALGDTVNTAARTEGVNKYFGTRVCCTEETVKRVPQLHFKKIGDVVLKGKVESVGLFNPINDSEVSQEPYLDYQKMYMKLESGSSDAADCVKQLALKYPEDALIQFHLQRVESGLVTILVHMEDK